MDARAQPYLRDATFRLVYHPTKRSAAAAWTSGALPNSSGEIRILHLKRNSSKEFPAWVSPETLTIDPIVEREVNVALRKTPKVFCLFDVINRPPVGSVRSVTLDRGVKMCEVQFLDGSMDTIPSKYLCKLVARPAGAVDTNYSKK